MRVLICDDHALLAEALSVYLAARGHEVVGCETTPTAAVDRVMLEAPDVLLMDIQYPDHSGLTAAETLHGRSSTRVVLFTGYVDEQALALLRSGVVQAVVSKGCPMRQLEAALSGEQPQMASVPGMSRIKPRSVLPLVRLTAREREILDLLVCGTSTTAMGTVLGIASSTVHTHVQSILSKLHVENRLEAVNAYLAMDAGGHGDPGAGNGATSR